jgi:recombination protein RecA
MPDFALIRSQVEAQLAGRVTAPFAPRTSTEKLVFRTGVDEIDSCIGGVPCGEITEIVGPRWCSTGRKSLQAQLLASGTKEHFCGLVDATDSFDPKSARAAGVNLRRLLWIRCGGQGIKTLEQAFKVADLLLQGSGGFGLVMVDLAGISEKVVRKVPMSTWFRFRAVVEKLDAPLVVLTSHPVIGSCSSLTLNLSRAKVRWSRPTPTSPAHASLPTGIDFDLQLTSRRFLKKPSQPVRTFSAQRQWA